MVQPKMPADGSLHSGAIENLPFPMDAVDGSIATRFESVTAHFPDHPAILTPGSILSYSALNNGSNRIADAILSTGVSGDQPVALYFEHDVASVMSIMAVLKTGRAYVSLDVSFPTERLSEMLRDSQAALLLTAGSFLEKAKHLSGNRIQVMNIDSISSSSAGNPSLDIFPETPSALFYTSGTTGKSKAVVQTNRSFLHRAWTQITSNRIGSKDRIAHLFHNGYSASIPNLYGALLSGATLCPFDLRQEGFQPFTMWMLETEVSILSIPVPFLRQWLKALSEDERFPSVRVIALGGQAVYSDDIIAMRPHFDRQAIVQIKWASTEANVYAEFQSTINTKLDVGIIPPGSPTPGRRIMILDESGSPLPAGEIGEIAVFSRYLTAGYWRDLELTQQRYREEPESGEQFCLTGDLGRLNEDGTLEFLGRSDTLIKIRSYRVQIEDVETAILRQADILQVAVIDRAGADGEIRLLAYVVLRDGASSTAEDVRDELRTILPEYMLPAMITVVETLPSGPSGKVDKAALAALQPQLAQLRYTPPQDELETRMVQLWEAILEMQPIGRTDDFFALGGSSLAAMRLFAGIEREFGTELPMTVLFGSPTIAELAALLRQGGAETAWSPLVAVQPRGNLPPFFCVSPLVVDVLAYRGLALNMGYDQPFYALYAHRFERPGPDQMQEYMKRLATQYIEEIRNLQPEGPYYLGGYSFGGKVAYEMARQLQVSGERVGLLALLETFGPDYLRDVPFLPKDLNRRIRNLPRLWTSLRNTVPWMRMHIETLRSMDIRGKGAYLRVKAATRAREMQRRLQKTIPRQKKRTKEGGDVAIPEPNLPAYEPGIYDGRVAIFRAATQMIGVQRDPAMGWGSRISGEIEVHTVPGFHDTILFGPRVFQLAEILNVCLTNARAAESND